MRTSLKKSIPLSLAAAALVVSGIAGPIAAQVAAPPELSPDLSRAMELYVSNRPEDHDPNRSHERDMRNKAFTDSVYTARAPGNYRFEKVWYRSRIGDLDIPAYVYRPLGVSAPGTRPVLVWAHGGAHGDWNSVYLPFVIEAVAKGYVVIAPDYRGSTGYGKEYHDEIDYGGYEIDDVISAVDYVAAEVPEADLDRVAVMGWSHGGYIASLAVFREEHPFRAAVAIVPVSNLVFRLSYKGPSYQALFSTQKRIQGLPFERRELYIERSPVYQVDGLRVPLMVQVATNDEDVDFVESEMFIHALQVKKPDLAETKIYEDPPGGHSFSTLVDRDYRVFDTPQLRDSWDRIWGFLERQLGPDSHRRSLSE